MNTLSALAQVVIAFSILLVWVGRFDNIVKEFKQFGFPDIFRNIIGALKISLATLLVVGIWYPELVMIPALLMGSLMLAAQMTHLKVRNPWRKFLPSLGLLLLSIFVALVHAGLVS